MAKKTTPLERIDADKRLAAPAAILRSMRDEMTALETERNALVLEEHFAALPDSSRKARGYRDTLLAERLQRLRGSAPQKPTKAPHAGGLLPAVADALAVIEANRGGTRPAHRLDRKALIQQIDSDCLVIHKGIVAQEAIVQPIQDELNAEQNIHDREARYAHRLRLFRLAQAFAAENDEGHEFRRSRDAAGYFWREELAPSSLLSRVLVLLGSETDWNSAISLERRALEELKIL